MSLLIYAQYDSVDAAEIAARRLRHTLPDVRIAGISHNRYADDSRETTVFAVPPANQPEGMSGGFLTGIPYVAYMADSLQDREFEPSMRDDAALRVETDSPAAARKAVSVLRNMHGREIHVLDKK